jgi:hypothetical protein
MAFQPARHSRFVGTAGGISLLGELTKMINLSGDKMPGYAADSVTIPGKVYWTFSKFGRLLGKV